MASLHSTYPQTSFPPSQTQTPSHWLPLPQSLQLFSQSGDLYIIHWHLIFLHFQPDSSFTYFHIQLILYNSFLSTRRARFRLSRWSPPRGVSGKDSRQSACLTRSFHSTAFFLLLLWASSLPRPRAPFPQSWWTWEPWFAVLGNHCSGLGGKAGGFHLASLWPPSFTSTGSWGGRLDLIKTMGGTKVNDKM